MSFRAILNICIRILFALLMAGSLLAEDIDNLREKSLEELMDITVVTVSKREESVRTAPAVVTVFTSDRIRQLGVSYLSEIIKYVPGFTQTNSYWRNELVTARGIKQTLYNDKILMLIDGIPANDAASMEHHLDMIPLSAVKQVEIIRGPGSTLYGTNAFAGVINVILWDDYSENKITGCLGTGAMDTRDVGVSYIGSHRGFSFLASGQITDNDGYDKTATDETGATGVINYEKDVESVFGRVSYRGLTVSGGKFIHKIGKFGAVPVFELGNMFFRDRARLDERIGWLNVQYLWRKNETIGGKVIARYSEIDSHSDIGDAGRFYQGLEGYDPDTISAPLYARFRGHVFAGEMQNEFILTDKVRLISGITVESRRIKDIGGHYDDFEGDLVYAGSVKTLPFTITDFAGYIQADGEISPTVGYVFGVRFSYLGISEKGFVTPRGGLVWRPFPTNSFKLLYGEAFRSPSAQEQYMRIPNIVVGKHAINGQLDPEQIQTLEFSVEQQIGEGHTLNANAFYTKIEDIIGRRPTTDEEMAIINDSSITYDNLGEQELRGIEVELSGYLSTRTSYFINGTLKDGENGFGGEIDYLSHFTLSGGFSTEMNTIGLSISPNFYYVDDREGYLQNGQMNSTKGFFIANLVLSQKISPHVMIRLTANNVFDEEYVYPEQVRRNIPTIPGGPGRTIFVKAIFKTY
ncbi:MAG: TonB-dependent receptor [Candidatus Zixiibacteriota bacterium]